MKRKWTIWITLAFAAVVSIGWWLSEPEPVYQGKAVSEWFEQIKFITNNSSFFLPSNGEAVHAIESMGKEAVPFLMRTLRRNVSPLHRKLYEWQDRFSGGQLGRDFRPTIAGYCLRVIGPQAEGAVPELAVWATRTGEPVKVAAIQLLGDIHARPEIGIPVLLAVARTGSEFERELAIDSLGKYGASAKSTVPMLILKWRSRDGEHYRLARVINLIDSEAATKEGIKQF